MKNTKTVIMCVALGGFLATSQAEFALLDDFESYAPAAELSGQSTNWTFDTADATVGSADGNQYLVQGTTANAHTVFNNSTTLLADNATGTYFFRALMPAGGSHNGTGVSAKEGYVNGWSDAGAIIRLGGSDPGSSIFGYDEATGGAGGYPLLTTNATTDLWYNFWVVLDNSGLESERTYDVYIQRDGDANFDTQAQIGTGLQYRADGNTQIGSIESLYFRSANDSVAAHFDDLYFDGAGENLTNPVGSGPSDPDPATITNFEFDESGDALVTFTPGGSGYVLSTADSLFESFLVESNAVYDGVDTFTVPASSLNTNQGFYRVDAP